MFPYEDESHLTPTQYRRVVYKYLIDLRQKYFNSEIVPERLAIRKEHEHKFRHYYEDFMDNDDDVFNFSISCKKIFDSDCTDSTLRLVAYMLSNGCGFPDVVYQCRDCFYNHYTHVGTIGYYPLLNESTLNMVEACRLINKETSMDQLSAPSYYEKQMSLNN